MSSPSFEDLDQTLARAEVEFGAAEVHGLLCGLISAQGRVDPGQLQREVLGPQAGGVTAALPELEEQLTRLRGLVLSQLAGGDLAFAPLLPEADEALGRRTSELGAWCRGYLYGLGLAGLPEPARLSTEARELLADLAEIGRGEFETHEGDEADESAYAEILEYVRMGAILLHDELQPEPPPSSRQH